MMLLRKTIYTLLTPPSIFFLLLLLVIIFYYRNHSRKLLMAVTFVFFSLSTPFVADHIHNYLNIHPALSNQDITRTDAQAIVLLSGGIYGYANEYDRNMPNANSILRAIYAAKLHKKTNLPILISGGGQRQGSPVGSALIQNFMQIELGTNVRWIETQSRTTIENAKYSKAFLSNKNISKIILVTEGSHMKRSVQSFRKAGFTVTPAPTFRSKQSYYFSWVDKVVPSANDLNRSMTGLHEILGGIWYELEDSDIYNKLIKNKIEISN